MDSFITILLQKIKQEYTQPFPEWKYKQKIPAVKWRWIQEECRKSSDFDTLRLRQQLLEKADQNKNMYHVSCDYGSVFMITDDEIYLTDVPWELWGRIFRLFYKTKPITVYLLANSSTRIFPSLTSHPIRPENINGGYTYPCRPDTIVIYRAEDATRVLIHELQHASCLDDHTQGVDEIEAKTEAWAELIYTAMLSKGNKKEWERLWSRQLSWIHQQNARIKQYMKSPLSKEFPWRYTLGKEQVIHQWFTWKHKPVSFSADLLPTRSLRLTAPPTVEQKKDHGIRPASIIL